jgi:type IV secretory pathway TrbD component
LNMADALPTPQLTVIHSSINRPTQWLGGDRELIIVTALLSFGLALSLATWWGVVISIVFWLSAAAVLQRMGKADPMLRQVYLRHIRFRYFYPAKSGLHSSGISLRAGWR